MATTESLFESTEIHPIDIVENIAETRDWDFDRIADDQIAMVVEGSWRSYSVTLAWSQYDECLRMICSFEMEPPKDRQAELYHTLNLVNDRCWTGGFSFWEQQKLMVYRYGLVCSGGHNASAEQIDQMMHRAVSACEQFYPAFQMACWGDQTAEECVNVAIGQAYGRA